MTSAKPWTTRSKGPMPGSGRITPKRFGEPERIVEAIATHHDDGRNNNLLGVLVQVADTLSAARPGARRGDAGDLT